MSASGEERSASIGDALDAPRPAPQLAVVGDPGPELEAAEMAPLRPGCPIKCLGISSDLGGDQVCFYLDVNGQLVGKQADKGHGNGALTALFGPQLKWLEVNYPKYGKPDKTTGKSKIVGYEHAQARDALIIECVRKGPFNPAGRLRGRGAHRYNENGLVLHCGDSLLVSVHKADGVICDWRWVAPGENQRFVYPASEGLPRPWHEYVDTAPAELMVSILKTWNFRRGLLDVRLMLGGIGQGYVGGALGWRSHIWITGGAGTGKSTLNGKDGLLHRTFQEMLFRTADTSAAGLRQRLKNSTVPVMIDEAEADENNGRINEVVKLARIASSGDNLTRGGNDHKAHDFTLESPFWFSSINIPPMAPQDLSRLAVLQLDPLPRGGTPPDFDKLRLGDVGRKLFRRMVQSWARLSATKAKFYAALGATGHTARACDQFATLLACADVLIEDHDTEDRLPDDEDVAFWVRQCVPERLIEISEAVSDQDRCLSHILTSMVQSRGGDEREALGSWVGRAVNLAQGSAIGLSDALEKANDRLMQLGLRVVNARWNPGPDGKGGKWGACAYKSGEPGFLAVANDHQQLKAIFAGSTWQGGVWRQSLGRCENALTGVTVKFGKLKPVRAVLVPLHLVLGDDDTDNDLPAASRPDALTAWIAQQKGDEA